MQCAKKTALDEVFKKLFAECFWSICSFSAADPHRSLVLVWLVLPSFLNTTFFVMSRKSAWGKIQLNGVIF